MKLPVTVSQTLRKLFPRPRIRRLENGLTVCILPNQCAPVVTTAVAYRAGGLDEEPAEGGVAHFLEHMMFKGSRLLGPGGIESTTRALGGLSNAFTLHDMTYYYFAFAAGWWRRGLEIEADRMKGLDLDPDKVDRERQVIVEEIAMHDSNPWQVLERRVRSALFGSHPYGRSVLGTHETLAAIDAEVLRAFHRRFYRPSNAVFAVAGNVGEEAEQWVEEIFGGLASGSVPERRPGAGGKATGSVPRPPRRVELSHGERPRLMLALPAPAASDPHHPALSLLLAVLGSGRTGRLYQTFVKRRLCSRVNCEITAMAEPSSLSISLEASPGVELERIEEKLLTLIDELRSRGPTAEEIARARKTQLSEWVFLHERTTQQAYLLSSSLILHDEEHPWRYLERMHGIDTEDLAEVADRYLRTDRGAVIGWSVPNAATTAAGKAVVI